MRKLLLIGVGGVGSYLTRALYEYDDNNQLFNLDITIADGDEVDTKNLTYQNFSEDDVLENKAKTLAKKYNFKYIDRFIDINHLFLKNFDIIICAVDGTRLRKDLYNYVFNINKKIYWIDVRSSGRSVAAYCKSEFNTYDSMLKTVPKNDIENSSCQLKYELDNDIVQGGNRIIAEIGAQLILTWHRGDAKTNPPKFYYNF